MGQRRKPSSSHCAKEESTRSPQIEHTLPVIGWISARQSGHTGKRETFSSGKPQSLQSDGKKIEKRLSAARRAHLRAS